MAVFLLFKINLEQLFKFVYKNESAWLNKMAEQMDLKLSGNLLELPSELGEGSISEFEVEDGFYVAFGEFNLVEKLEYVMKPDRVKKGVTIFFKYIERGSSIFTPTEGEYKEINFGGVQFFSSDVYNNLIFPKNTHGFIFRVYVTIAWLKSNLLEFIQQSDSFYEMIFGNEKIMHFEPLTNRFLRLFSDVFKSEFDQKLNQLIVKDKGYEAVVLFFDHFYKKFFKGNINLSKYSIDDQKRLYGLIDFIKTNLDKELTHDQLIRLVGFSKSKLQAMFHHFFHQSIYAYIKNLRLEIAVEMLKGTPMDIRQIARHLGYHSSTHFINIFKKHYGMAPKKFRTEKLSFKIK